MTTTQSSQSINSQDFSNINWFYNPQNLPINEALLLGAKELLKAVYDYSEDAPDYLPFSYNNKNNKTGYVVHAVKQTHVLWKQIKWQTQPEGSPKGWSATVTDAGLVTTPNTPECFTDCSGFITALFCYANANLQYPTQFHLWMKGESIPEAGCFNPDNGCDKPNPANYYRLFIQDHKSFKNVTLENLMPGDLIAYANTKNHNDTGHIMLVAAVGDCPDDSQSKLVVVIDETGSLHTCDTRKAQSSGIGMGIAKLKLSNSAENPLKFYWSVYLPDSQEQPEPEIGAIALGRAQ
ncbi:hypothetical protein LC653_35720 [Nostoc sp. CHAB 5784]|uniref:hypothetical protein n=1 Tax=Nostoc mirabile TaxID=2907820 RepID=UPI001E464BCB|nr:hypothetical protein [Nostoc mirabile]MCC5669067.1 hypothetical protein [Nostoc mirabile CHAB5784]